MKSPLFLFLACGLLAPQLATAATVRVESPTGVSVQFDGATGHYEIAARRPAWIFGGELGQPATDTALGQGTDALGAYQEVRFSWRAGTRCSGSLRVYEARPVVLLSVTCDEAAEKLPTLLPRFTAFPAGLHHFSYKDAVFAPPAFALEKNGTPWLLFDDQANAAIISPAANFMTAAMVGDGVGEIGCGLNPGVGGLPAGFTHRTLMALGEGINATWDLWGDALTTLAGKKRPANDADVGLRYLGYWTDNGAVYYYNYDAALGYAGTLEQLVRHYRDNAIPLRYLQLDSWWYYKSLTDPDGKALKPKNGKLPEGEWNRYGGLLKYEAHPAVLPDGLAGFEKKVGVPLITHNRWIDRASPYRADFKVSGYAAVDPRWWDGIMGYLNEGGVVCYEQDWLNVIYQHSPALETVPGVGEAFTDNMARAARAKGMSVQYCMALPRYYLQGSRYDNLTTARASDDRFKRNRWYPFVYTSRLAGAMGIWPWTDVFMSTETENLLIATLSAGMVGIGDAMGREAPENLRRVTRPDGMLIKPDAPLYPIDEMYLVDANGGHSPMVTWTHTDHAEQRTAYVLAFDRNKAASDVAFTPAALGFTGEVMILNMTTQIAWREPADERFFSPLDPASVGYFIIVPVGPSGLAFFGDSKTFVTNGRKRIAGLETIPDGVTASVVFASGEKSVRLFGYSRRLPQVHARSGTAGPVNYDPETGRFAVEVFPASEVTPEPPGGDPVQSAVIDVTVFPALRIKTIP